MSKPEKFPCYVTYCSEFPGGMVWERREDALEYTKNMREEFGDKAYARVKYFTQEELDAMPDPDNV